MRRPIPAPDPAPARLVNDELPPVRYLPGASPHPGHAAPLPIQDAYVAGIDRYNQRYYWEAHELWETAWRAVRADEALCSLLQGLIQLAAAVITHHVGRPASGARLLERAKQHLAIATRDGVDCPCGADVAAAVDEVAAFLAGGAWPGPLRLVSRPRLRAPVRVVGAVLIEQRKLLAARRAPRLARGGLWEIPGGKVEAGEGDGEALERELAEELGVEVVAGEAVGEVVFSYPDVQIRLVAVRATLKRGELRLVDHDEVRWVEAEALDGLAWAPADRPLLPAIRALLIPSAGC